MRSMFVMGIQHPSRMGQFDFGGIISAAISAGVGVWKAKSEMDLQKKQMKMQEEQANAAAARQEEALRIQQESLKALQTANQQTTAQASTATGPGGTPSNQILGMEPTTFFIVAGLSAGALVLGTLLLTKK
jgi:hypothetical protein